MRLRLYAVLPRKTAAVKFPSGLEREPLRIVRFGALAFVVGQARTFLPPVRANLVAHDRVISRIARVSQSILPARFGMVIDDAVRLKVLALDRATEIGQALEMVAGGEQMTVRLVVPQTGARTVQTLRPASGVEYLRARAAAARGPDVPEIRTVRAQMAPLVRAERVSLGQEAGVLTIYHLIDRGRAARYRALVRKMRKPGRIRVSGPFAPYAFVPETFG